MQTICQFVLLCFLLALVPEVTEAALPDESSWKQVSEDGRFVLVMIGPTYVNERYGRSCSEFEEILWIRSIYRQSGLYPNDGSTTPIWTVPFHDKTHEFFIGPNGQYLIVADEGWSDWSGHGGHVATFYSNGNLLASYSNINLLSMEEMCLPARNDWESLSFDPGSMTLTSCMRQGNQFVFDVTPAKSSVGLHYCRCTFRRRSLDWQSLRACCYGWFFGSVAILDLQEPAEMPETFRVKTSLKYLWPFCAMFFLSQMILCICLAFFDESGKVNLVAVLLTMVPFWGTMFVLSIYSWVGCYVERLTIDGTRISLRSIWQDHQFDVSQLESLTWTGFADSIFFRCPDQKLRLYWSNYSKEDQLRIIELLRGIVPESVQEGWPMFCHTVALPLRDGTSFRERVHPASDFYTVTRQRYDRVAVVVIPMAFLIALTIGVWFNQWKAFVPPACLVFVWLLVRFGIPKEGRKELRLAKMRPFPIPAALLGFGGIAIGFLLIGVLPLGGVGKTTATAVGMVTMGMGFVAMLYLVYKFEKKQQLANEQAAISAPEQWRQGVDHESDLEQKSM